MDDAASSAGSEMGLWVAFGLVVAGMLALDLGVFHRRSHAESLRAAIGGSVFWVALGLVFGGWVWVQLGPRAGTEYLAAYLLEKSLSVDNLFVISVVFTYFKVPPAYQHRVLFWGILGALVMRGPFIGLGIEVIHRFEFMTALLGLFLVYTAAKLLMPRDHEDDPGNDFLARIARRYLRFAEQGDGDRFTVVVQGRRLFSPLFFVLLVIEGTDVVFAVDSIPAVLGITTDAYVVSTSNVFAILGLRALYFVLADMILRFHYVKCGLSVILGFVGVKMLAAAHVEVPTLGSLVLIVAVLVTTTVASVVRDRRLSREAEGLREAHPWVPSTDEQVSGMEDREVERLLFLRRIPIFQGVPLEQLRPLVTAAHLRAYSAGTQILAQGAEADALYVVVSGSVRIERDAEDGSRSTVAVMGPREYLGEMALLSGQPRAAAAVADTDTVLLALARGAFLEVGTRHPAILLEVIRVLSARLRAVVPRHGESRSA